MIMKLLKKQYAPLIFSLFCGLVYFGIALNLIVNYTENGGLLLAFFFSPAIICGAALLIIKVVKIYMDEENEKKINFVFWSHIVLAFVSLVLAVGAFV